MPGQHFIVELRYLILKFSKTSMNQTSDHSQLLVDFEYEKDLVSISQAAILLSYHSPSTSERKVNSYWLSIAIQHAKFASAHLYHTSSLPPPVYLSHKKLWWCCIMRDRVLNLGLRRAVHITFTPHDFSPLTASDFDAEVSRSRVYDASTKRRLLELLISQCEMAVELTGVLMRVYPLNGFMEDYSKSKDHDQFEAEIEACRNGLGRWYEKAVQKFPLPAGIGEKGVHDSVVLYTNLLYIYF
jgi:hypothetical protein